MNLFRQIAAVFTSRQDAAGNEALSRLVYQVGERLASRGLDVGETPAWTDSWRPSAGSINVDLERSLRLAVARSRDLATNTDWGRRAMLLFRINVLGPAGMRLQSRISRSDGTLRKNLNEMVEAFWVKWCRRGNCEVTGKLSFRHVEKLLLDHLVRDGEWLFRLVEGGPLGFQVQVLNPQLLDPTYRGEYQGRRIRLSIELDTQNRPVAYWLRADAEYADYVAVGMGDQRRIRIPAEEISHFFIPEDADQLRGMPWFTSGARRLWLLKMFEESAAVASTNAARRAGFFVSPDGEAPPGFADTIVSGAIAEAKRQGIELSPGKLKYLQDQAGRYATTMPGQFDTLPQGYDFKAFESKFPDVAYGEYAKEQVRGFTAGLGMSHATGGNNLEAVNYSSAQVGIRDEREMFKTVQEDICEALHEVIFPHALAAGLLTFAGLRAFPPSAYEQACDASRWIKRRWADIDPLKAANSNDLNLKNRLTSPQRIIEDRGDDPEEIGEEWRNWIAEFGDISGGNATADQSAAANADEQAADAQQQDSNSNSKQAANGGRNQPPRLMRVRGV